jgi:hypothetical protein
LIVLRAVAVGVKALLAAIFLTVVALILASIVTSVLAPILAVAAHVLLASPILFVTPGTAVAPIPIILIIPAREVVTFSIPAFPFPISSRLLPTGFFVKFEPRVKFCIWNATVVFANHVGSFDEFLAEHFRRFHRRHRWGRKRLWHASQS